MFEESDSESESDEDEQDEIWTESPFDDDLVLNEKKIPGRLLNNERTRLIELNKKVNIFEKLYDYLSFTLSSLDDNVLD